MVWDGGYYHYITRICAKGATDMAFAVRTDDADSVVRLAQEYLDNVSSDTLGYILPGELKEKMDRGEAKDLFLLDVRLPEDYQKFHIPGTINIPFKEIAREENLSRLPRDKQIIVICYLGHTSSQVISILGMLGFKAQGMKFGMGVVPTPGMCKNGWLESYYPFESG